MNRKPTTVIKETSKKTGKWIEIAITKGNNSMITLVTI